VDRVCAAAKSELTNGGDGLTSLRTFFLMKADPQSATQGATATAAPDQTNKPQGIEFHGVSDVYSESGIDLTLLRGNLRRSIEERWENIRRAAEFARALQQSSPEAQLINRLLQRSLPMTDVAAFLKRQLIGDFMEISRNAFYVGFKDNGFDKRYTFYGLGVLALLGG
jgi:hypothetical protein